MKFKFRHADKIVGLFTLIALAMLVALVLFAGVNKRWFTKKVFYETRFTSAEGLREGMSVNLRGFEIGRVKSFTLNPTNQVDLVFFIYEEYHDRVRPDSVVELPSSLLGSGGGLQLYPGLGEGEPLVAGTFIPSTQLSEGRQLVKSERVDKPQGSDPISEVLSILPGILLNVDDTILGIDSLLAAAETNLRGQGEEPLAASLRNVEATTAALEPVVRDVNAITTSLAALASELESPEGLVSTLLAPEGSLATLLNDDDALWNQIMAILMELEGAMGQVNTLAGSFSTVSPQLAMTMDEVIISLREAQKVMEGLQNNPLLRRGISDEVRPSAPGDETREEAF